MGPTSFHKRAAVRERYNITYLSYDELYREEQFSKYRLALGLLNKDLIKGRVIDVGCGTALLLEFLSNYLNGILTNIQYYVCLDIAANMLRLARDRIHRLGYDYLTDLVEGDAQQLPLRDVTFDVSFSFTVFTLLDNPEQGVNEMVRVTRSIAIYSLLKKGQRSLQSVPRRGKLIAEDVKDTIHLIDLRT